MARTIAIDHDVKREQILQAAAEVFAKSGFHGASMSQVAKACGLSKPAIYHYYDGKEAVLFDLLDRYLQQLRDRIVAVAGEGVTLGALSFPQDEGGTLIRNAKRHPTIEDNVTIYAGATILGGDTVIGRGSTIGGNVFIMESVPPNSFVTSRHSELHIKPNKAK